MKYLQPGRVVQRDDLHGPRERERQHEVPGRVEQLHLEAVAGRIRQQRHTGPRLQRPGHSFDSPLPAPAPDICRQLVRRREGAIGGRRQVVLVHHHPHPGAVGAIGADRGVLVVGGHDLRRVLPLLRPALRPVLRHSDPVAVARSAKADHLVGLIQQRGSVGGGSRRGQQRSQQGQNGQQRPQIPNARPYTERSNKAGPRTPPPCPGTRRFAGQVEQYSVIDWRRNHSHRVSRGRRIIGVRFPPRQRTRLPASSPHTSVAPVIQREFD